MEATHEGQRSGEEGSRQGPETGREEFQPRLPSAERKAELIKALLPETHEPYTDKYFLRSEQILREQGLNPFVRAQVFIRKGEAELRGMDEALAMIDKYTDLIDNGGRVFALEDGDYIENKETVMVLEGRIQDLIGLETMYLGVIAGETTIANGGQSPDLQSVEAKMKEIVEIAGGRDVFYMGARHWRYDSDRALAAAAIAGGAAGASTDIGAEVAGLKGMGTIPHALENIMAWRYGADRAVVEATRAFDAVMDPAIPRIALIDYNNREISDSLTTARELNGALNGVRVDTCGENVAQGAIPHEAVLKSLLDSLASGDEIDLVELEEVAEQNAPGSFDIQEVHRWIDTATTIHESGIEISDQDLQYWAGTGVTISGVFALRQGLDLAGNSDVDIILSSGFGKKEKVEAFVRAEEILGAKLFEALGVGGLYDARMSTMDIVAVADEAADLDDNPFSKIGRTYQPNAKLKLMRGEPIDPIH
jgi:nicotinate phosphoribosyltransferase